MKEEKRNTPKTNSFLSTELIPILVLVIICLLFAFIKYNFIGISFERDEGEYAYLGKLWLEGFQPYSYFYEKKPPGIFISYGLIQLIFGYSFKSIQIGFIFIHLLTLIFTFYSLRNFAGLIGATAGTLTFGFLSMNPYNSGFTTQAEHLILLMVSIGIWFFSRSLTSKSLWYIFLCGLFLTCGALIKQNGLFFIITFGLSYIFLSYAKTKSAKATLKTVLIYSLGSLSMLGVAFFYLIINGNFDDFIFWTYTFPSESYLTKMSLDKSKELFGYFLFRTTENYKVFWILGVLGLLLSWFKCSAKIKPFVGLSLLIAGILAIMPGLRFYGHYWLLIIPAISFGVALFMDILAKASYKYTKYSKYLVLTLIFGIVLYHISIHKYYLLNKNEELTMRAVYGENPFMEIKELSKIINRKKEEGDQLAVFGSEPQAYIYTGLSTPSRHNYFEYLVCEHPKHVVWQSELISSIEQSPPRFILDVNYAISWLRDENSDIKIFNWKHDFLTNSYKKIGFAELVNKKINYVTSIQEIYKYQPKSDNFIYLYELR